MHSQIATVGPSPISTARAAVGMPAFGGAAGIFCLIMVSLLMTLAVQKLPKLQNLENVFSDHSKSIALRNRHCPLATTRFPEEREICSINFRRCRAFTQPSPAHTSAVLTGAPGQLGSTPQDHLTRIALGLSAPWYNVALHRCCARFAAALTEVDIAVLH
jgi:hypothetical protein